MVFSEPVSGFIQTDLKVSVAGNTSANITDWAANPDSAALHRHHHTYGAGQPKEFECLAVSHKMQRGTGTSLG